MSIKHVGVSSLRSKEKLQDLIRVVTFSKPCPQIDAPRCRPTRGLIAANLKRPFRSLGQFRCTTNVDVVSREETKQMRDVTVVRLGSTHIPIFQPFLELSFPADLKGREPGTVRCPLCTKVTIDIQDFGSLRYGGKEFAQNFLIHRGPRCQ